MVIKTPHVVRSILQAKSELSSYQKLVNSTRSSISIRLTYRGCASPISELYVTDIQCFMKRITVGRVSSCTIQIPEDKISRYHACIECSLDGEWTFRDMGSRSGSAVKLNPGDLEFPKFGSVHHRLLKPEVPYHLQNNHVIMIGRAHQGFANELAVTIQHTDNVRNGQTAALSSATSQPTLSRKLTWRRSLHCNGCMGWGRRHSCSARLSQLQKMIVDCNKQSNMTAARPIKTALQKVLFHRVSGWWPKKEEKKKIAFTVPERYENDTVGQIERLPDSQKPNEELLEEDQNKGYAVEAAPTSQQEMETPMETRGYS